MKLSPFELKDELITDRQRPDPGQVGEHAVPERGTRQSELDRDHAARGVLPARPVRAGGVQARLGRAGPRRHAPAQGHRRATRALPEARRRQRRGGAARGDARLRRPRRSASTPTASCTSSPTRSSATTTRCRTACSCTASDRPRVPREGDVRRPAARREVRPLRRRGRHGGHVLHLQQPARATAPQGRGHDRARHADLHAVHRDDRTSRASRRSTSSSPRWRRACTPGSTRTPS